MDPRPEFEGAERRRRESAYSPTYDKDVKAVSSIWPSPNIPPPPRIRALSAPLVNPRTSRMRRTFPGLPITCFQKFTAAPGPKPRIWRAPWGARAYRTAKVPRGTVHQDLMIHSSTQWASMVLRAAGPLSWAEDLIRGDRQPFC